MSWTMQEAVDHFPEIMNAALSGSPQEVSQNGRRAVVVLSAREYERLRRLDQASNSSLAALLLEMPQDDEDFERSAQAMRNVDL